MSQEQEYAVIQGVKVPVMVVDGVELPIQAVKGYTDAAGNPTTVEVHDCTYDGVSTYHFWVKDPANNMDTENTFMFDPHASSY